MIRKNSRILNENAASWVVKRDKEIYLKVIEDTLRQIPVLQERSDKAIQEDDHELLKKCCHTLRTTLKIIGALEAYQAATSLAEAAAAHQPVRIRTRYQKLNEALDRLKEHIELAMDRFGD
jgi:HPt (histidine-containing phosphotransfer) domain-containing protein